MKRYNVYLSEPQIKKLEEIQKKNGLSKSESIRRAIDDFIINHFLPFDFKEFLNKVSLCNDLDELHDIEYDAFEETIELEDPSEIIKRLSDIASIQRRKILSNLGKNLSKDK